MAVQPIPDSNAAAVAAAKALYQVLSHSSFVRSIKAGATVDEAVPELLVARLLGQRVGLGSGVFGISDEDDLIFEKGRNTEQADIVGYALRAGADPQGERNDATDWVARVQIEVKIFAAYNARKQDGRYVGESQLDRYADYADAHKGVEPHTACWVLMPDSRAGAGPRFVEAYADMAAQGVQRPERWRVATWGHVRTWLQEALGEDRLTSDEHTDLVLHLARGV
jgi:hypothetical protein